LTTVPTVSPAAAPAEVRRRLRLPLIAALALAFVSLALISGIAYLVVLTGATGTAERLLVDRAQRIVEAQVSVIRDRLDPVTEQLEFISALVAAGRVDIEQPVGRSKTDGRYFACALLRKFGTEPVFYSTTYWLDGKTNLVTAAGIKQIDADRNGGGKAATEPRCDVGGVAFDVVD